MKKFVLLFLLLPLWSAAEERILSFHSDIVVKQDGWIEVTETIRVRAEGQRIRRGIYRDFPTEYRDRLGNDYVVAFEPLAVLRNGAGEDYHTEHLRRGIRTYFGSSDRYIPNGEHVYTFRYRASRMLGFFEDHDELYWNVTGFDWAFPIDAASASVSFDFNVAAADLGAEAYTGPYGSTGQDYRFDVVAADLGAEANTGSYGSTGQDYRHRVGADSRVEFAALSPLSAANGLTIVVTWPKGLVEAPGTTDRVVWLLQDNLNLLVAVAGLIALLAYYIPVWNRHGKDPEAGVLVTRYIPPEAYSPASLRYVRQMYYDDKTMTAAILSLAVKGYLRINKPTGDYVLKKVTPAGEGLPLATGERELYEALFRKGDRVVLENDNHALLGGAKTAHRESLAADYKNRYFQTNSVLLLPGAVIFFGTVLASLSLGSGPSAAVFVVLALMVAVAVLFGLIMRRPTIRGRQLMDQMLGFRDYLDIAEKDEMNLRNPPKKTPELFEAYLPFALALGVDQAWSEKFAAVLATIRGPDGQAYQPAWYSGTWNMAKFSRSVNSLSSGLSSAVSSSVTPPGSSSGSGGGGFSGGGGGGGGGGGW